MLKNIIIFGFVFLILCLAYLYINPIFRPKFCGGISGLSCDFPYTCNYDGKFPDAGGICLLFPFNIKIFNELKSTMNITYQPSSIPTSEPEIIITDKKSPPYERKPIISAGNKKGWNLFKGETQYTSNGETLFTVEYPSAWEKYRKGYTFYLCGNTNCKITFGAGGRGAPDANEYYNFPGGIVRVYLELNEKTKAYWGYGTIIDGPYYYIFEVQDVLLEQYPDFKKTFLDILKSFKKSTN